MSLEALQGTPTSFHPAIHAARPLPGQGRSAEALRALLAGSAIVESHRWCDKVQAAYSLRCAPQVHGASRDLLEHVERTVSIELNAATDNPLVLLEEGLIVSNGNFHGQPIAIGLDCLAIACAEFGTYDANRVFWALRAENWLHVHGQPESEQGRRIRAELLEVFRPADPAWRRRVLEVGAGLLERAGRGLAHL